VGDCEFGLLKAEDGTPYIQRGRHGSRAGATITFTSQNIREDRKRLEAASAVIIEEKKYPWGHVLIFEDTEGNVLRLMKEP
jgi:predicted enzyme related to lactoylglutathione lyase